MARSTSDLPGPLRTRVRENARIIVVVPGCCIFYSSLILVLLFQLIAIVIGFGSTVQLLLLRGKATDVLHIHTSMLLRTSLCARMNIQGKFYASKLNNNQVTSTYSTITTTSCIDTVL